MFSTRISVLLFWQHPEWIAKHSKPEAISIDLHTTKGQIKYPIYVTLSQNITPCIFHAIKEARSFTTAFVGQWCNPWVYTVLLRQKGVVRDIIQHFLCGKQWSSVPLLKSLDESHLPSGGLLPKGSMGCKGSRCVIQSSLEIILNWLLQDKDIFQKMFPKNGDVLKFFLVRLFR